MEEQSVNIVIRDDIKKKEPKCGMMKRAGERKKITGGGNTLILQYQESRLYKEDFNRGLKVQGQIQENNK